LLPFSSFAIVILPARRETPWGREAEAEILEGTDEPGWGVGVAPEGGLCRREAADVGRPNLLVVELVDEPVPSSTDERGGGYREKRGA
jgi:hypothetical protein